MRLTKPSEANTKYLTFPTTHLRDQATAKLVNGQEVKVMDASGDPKIKSGWAIYKYNKVESIFDLLEKENADEQIKTDLEKISLTTYRAIHVATEEELRAALIELKELNGGMVIFKNDITLSSILLADYTNIIIDLQHYVLYLNDFYIHHKSRLSKNVLTIERGVLAGRKNPTHNYKMIELESDGYTKVLCNNIDFAHVVSENGLISDHHIKSIKRNASLRIEFNSCSISSTTYNRIIDKPLIINLSGYSNALHIFATHNKYKPDDQSNRGRLIAVTGQAPAWEDETDLIHDSSWDLDTVNSTIEVVDVPLDPSNKAIPINLSGQVFTKTTNDNYTNLDSIHTFPEDVRILQDFDFDVSVTSTISLKLTGTDSNFLNIPVKLASGETKYLLIGDWNLNPIVFSKAVAGDLVNFHCRARIFDTLQIALTGNTYSSNADGLAIDLQTVPATGYITFMTVQFKKPSPGQNILLSYVKVFKHWKKSLASFDELLENYYLRNPEKPNKKLKT